MAARSPAPAKRLLRPQAFRASATGRLCASISASTSMAAAIRPGSLMRQSPQIVSRRPLHDARRGSSSLEREQQPYQQVDPEHAEQQQADRIGYEPSDHMVVGDVDNGVPIARHDEQPGDD